MNINRKESSTDRGAIGLGIAAIGLLILAFDDDYANKITVLLLLGKGISDYLKVTQPDNKS